jgi:RNA polymerase sigma-70 factor (ECF subfamily)
MSNERTTAWSAEIEEIYRCQGRELWALFYAQCNDPERAHDALQEAFARLQKQDGDEIRDKRAWLLRVGRNWLRDMARRQRNAAIPADFLHEISGSTEEPSKQLETRELHGKVRELLKQMREEDREVLVLRYALGWSSIRIGKTLDTTPSAVDMRLSRARRRLAELLQRNGIDHEPL